MNISGEFLFFTVFKRKTMQVTCSNITEYCSLVKIIPCLHCVCTGTHGISSGTSLVKTDSNQGLHVSVPTIPFTGVTWALYLLLLLHSLPVFGKPDT